MKTYEQLCRIIFLNEFFECDAENKIRIFLLPIVFSFFIQFSQSNFNFAPLLIFPPENTNDFEKQLTHTEEESNQPLVHNDDNPDKFTPPSTIHHHSNVSFTLPEKKVTMTVYTSTKESLTQLKTMNTKCIKSRTVLWWLVFVGFAINYMIRINLNITIVDMVMQKRSYSSNSSTVFVKATCFNDGTAMSMLSDISNKSILKMDEGNGRILSLERKLLQKFNVSERDTYARRVEFYRNFSYS